MSKYHNFITKLNPEKSICKICLKPINTCKGSTSKIIHHLNTVHKNCYEENKTKSDSEQKTIVMKMKEEWDKNNKKKEREKIDIYFKKEEKKYEQNQEENIIILISISLFVILCGLPIALIFSKYFLKLISYIQPKLKSVSDSLMNKIFSSVLNVCDEKIKNLTPNKSKKMISISFDDWTNNSLTSFGGFVESCIYYDDFYSIKEIGLGLSQYNSSTSGDELKKKALYFASKNYEGLKSVFITTDKASNNKYAFSNSKNKWTNIDNAFTIEEQFYWNSCSVHNIETISKQLINFGDKINLNTNELIKECRKLIKMLKNSDYRKQFESIKKLENEKIEKMKLPAKTRFSTNLYSLNQVYTNWDIIKSIKFKQKDKFFKFTEERKKMIKDIIFILNPLHESIEIASSKGSCSKMLGLLTNMISIFKGYNNNRSVKDCVNYLNILVNEIQINNPRKCIDLKKYISELIEDNDLIEEETYYKSNDIGKIEDENEINTDLENLASIAIGLIYSYFGLFRKNTIYLISSFFDPEELCNVPEKYFGSIKLAVQRFIKMFELESIEEIEIIEKERKEKKNKSSKRIIIKGMKTLYEEKEKKQQKHSFESQFDQYIQIAKVLRNDKLLFWSFGHFPDLVETALFFISFQHTSIAVERLFSKAGVIDDEKRNRLDGDKFETLTLAYSNRDLLDIDDLIKSCLIEIEKKEILN